MAATGLQNNQWGQERGVSLGFGALLSTFLNKFLIQGAVLLERVVTDTLWMWKSGGGGK